MIPVKRIKRKKNIADNTSPELYYLVREPKRAKLYTTEKLGKRVEETGALSKEDFKHAWEAGTRVIREILVAGDKVKIDGLGMFRLSFSCEGSENEKDCTVRKIRKVNLCFLPDRSMKLVNNATAQTRSENNVEFYIENIKDDSAGNGSETGGDDDDDPTA